MLNIFVIIMAVLLLAVLLYSERRENRRVLVPVKTALSALFIVAVLIQPQYVPWYFLFLLLGLIFCLVGDVFLALPQEKMFLLGLISFLLGHVCYVFAFFAVGTGGVITWTGTLIVAAAGCFVYFWLKPHLGSMKLPVLFYIVVISTMVCGAVSVLSRPEIFWVGRVIVFSGAVLFYVSDIFVARDRFLKKHFLNRLLGLPMYYAGQFLIAFSVGFLREG